MNGFKTQVESGGPPAKPPSKKRLSAHEMDELCKTCGHMRRLHMEWSRRTPCGSEPCECTDFVPTGTYYDWSKK